MQCPVCKTTELVAHNMDANLLSRQCPSCGGQWLPSFQYWKWRKQQGPDLPELPAEEGADLPVQESHRAKACPECNHVLLPYRVGHALNFSLDRCGNCGGVWFDKNEWEILKSRNLHDDVHFIFSQAWQAAVFQEQRREAKEQLRMAMFGEEDLAEIRRVKTWIDSHPKRNELVAFLLYGNEGNRDQP